MHYRDDGAGFGFDVIGTVSDYTDMLDEVLAIDGSEIDSTESYDGRILVLKPKMI